MMVLFQKLSPGGKRLVLLSGLVPRGTFLHLPGHSYVTGYVLNYQSINQSVNQSMYFCAVAKYWCSQVHSDQSESPISSRGRMFV